MPHGFCTKPAESALVAQASTLRVELIHSFAGWKPAPPKSSSSTSRAASRPIAAALGATERRRGLLLIRISIAANNTQVAAARSGVRRLVTACSASVNRQTGRLAALLHGPRSTLDGSKGVAANPGGKPPVCGSIGLRKAATSRRTPERADPVLMTAKCRGDWMYSIRSLRFLYSSLVLSGGQKFV